MRTPNEIRRELSSDLDDAERETLVALAMRLQAERPLPPASFRGDLGRKLLGASEVHRPVIVMNSRTIRVLIASYVTSGLLLLVVAAIGLAGTGPFASS